MVYIVFQGFHLVHLFYSIFCYGHLFCTLNLFHITCMRYFVKRFKGIERRIESICSPQFSERVVDNRKLSKQIADLNRVHYDLIQINDFFKYQVGFNLLGFSGFEIAVVFLVLLDIDWRSGIRSKLLHCPD